MTKNTLLTLLIEVARRQLTPEEQTALRDALAPVAHIGTPPPGEYNTAQIAWELQETALGNTHHGNALRVAKDIPGVTADDRAPALEALCKDWLADETDDGTFADSLRQLFAK